MKFNTSKGTIILQQLEQQGLSKKQMQSFVIACIQHNLEIADNAFLNEDPQIYHNSSGKPFLGGENAPNISISYAKNWIAIYLSNKEQVGIDIEICSNKILKIIELFLTDSEKNKLPDLTIETIHLIC